ncbi:MAG: hypothetical protein ACI8Y7_000934 [Candidatus Woesearchaeota archaeon]|jgi:hypothetical protein
MIKTLTRKFGKLVRVDADCSSHIDSIRITGDFFLHPEESIDNIEAIFVDLPLTFDVGDTISELKVILTDCELIGVTIPELVEFISEVANAKKMENN